MIYSNRGSINNVVLASASVSNLEDLNGHPDIARDGSGRANVMISRWMNE